MCFDKRSSWADADAEVGELQADRSVVHSIKEQYFDMHVISVQRWKKKRLPLSVCLCIRSEIVCVASCRLPVAFTTRERWTGGKYQQQHEFYCLTHSSRNNKSNNNANSRTSNSQLTQPLSLRATAPLPQAVPLKNSKANRTLHSRLKKTSNCCFLIKRQCICVLDLYVSINYTWSLQ